MTSHSNGSKRRLAIAAEFGDRHSTARLFGCLGHCHLGRGDLRTASHFAEQYLVGSRASSVIALESATPSATWERLPRLQGDLTSSRMLLEESIRAIPEGTDLYSLLDLTPPTCGCHPTRR